MNLFTRNSPYYHLLKYLLFLLKHPVHIYIYTHTHIHTYIHTHTHTHTHTHKIATMSDIVVENAHVLGCGAMQDLNAVKSHYRTPGSRGS